MTSRGTRLSLTPLYEVPSCAHMLKHIEAFKTDQPSPSEAINNVYELPRIEPAIRYLHGAAGFPTQATWLKAIRYGIYLLWPLVNVKNVNKFFPDSEETQKGNMRTQRQGVQSTKNHCPAKSQTSDEAKPTEEPMQPPILKKKDIFIAIYPPRNTIYTDQTGKFLHSSSRGSNHQMIRHEIYGASAWVEVMKNRTEGETIEARCRGLIRIKKQDITPAHQFLNSKTPQTYKYKIRESGMSHQLVLSDDHRRNTP